jgi:hypothetical protein
MGRAVEPHNAVGWVGPKGPVRETVLESAPLHEACQSVPITLQKRFLVVYKVNHVFFFLNCFIDDLTYLCSALIFEIHMPLDVNRLKHLAYGKS